MVYDFLSRAQIRSVGYCADLYNVRVSLYMYIISDAIKGSLSLSASREATRPAATRANQQIFSVFRAREPGILGASSKKSNQKVRSVSRAFQ